MAATSTTAAARPSPELLQLTVSGRARRRRHRARWRRRPAGDGRSPRPHRRRRPAALHHRARRASAAGELQGPGGRHGDEQPRARASRCASRASSSGAPRSATATCWRCCKEHGGVLGGETSGHISVPRPHHHRRRAGQRAAGAGRDEARPASRWRELAAGMPKFPQVMLNVRVARALRSAASARGPGRGAPASRPAGATRARRAARLRHRTGDPGHGRRARTRPQCRGCAERDRRGRAGRRAG